MSISKPRFWERQVRDPITLAAAGTLLSTTVIGSVTVGQIALTLALSGASFLLQSAAQGQGAAVDQGLKQTVQAPIYPERLVYGRQMVGGRVFFYEVKPPYLYVGLEIASHEIDAIEQVQINGQVVTFDGTGAANSTNFVNGSTPYVYFSARLGTATHACDPIIDADFAEIDSANWRQRGHACVVFKCYYGSSADDHNKYWGASGFPEFLMLVRGMKVFNPRDPTQSVLLPATWKWSRNASLCQAHFLTYDKGMGKSWSSINLSVLSDSAIHDDEGISLASGGVEMRYSLDGAIDPNQAPGDTLQNLMTANLGDVVWSNGAYKFYSGVPRTAVWTLNDDSARGDMEVRVTRDRASLINLVRTVFVSEDRDYQTVNGPILENLTYAAADGEAHELTLQLPFTSSASMAQRIAKVTMEKSRLGRQITRRESIDALRLEATDAVNFEMAQLPSLGFTGRIESLKLDMDNYEFEIVATEYSGSAFDWSPSEEQAFSISPATLSGVN